MFFVHVGSEEYGGDLFGDYDTADEGAAAVGRLAIKAFQVDPHNVGSRSYTIIEADNRDEAERIVNEVVRG